MVAFCKDEGDKPVIPVMLQPEPANFDMNVRRPGLRFLANFPTPTSRQFNHNRYWRLALPELKTAYQKICSYSGLWSEPDSSVDHFESKSARPELAYEWSNYRLAHKRINNFKSNKTGLLDPFAIQAGWFVLDMATARVVPAAYPAGELQNKIVFTIDALGLNEEWLVEIRFEVISLYLFGDLSLEDLNSYYPFIASEIQRQAI